MAREAKRSRLTIYAEWAQIIGLPFVIIGTFATVIGIYLMIKWH